MGEKFRPYMVGVPLAGTLGWVLHSQRTTSNTLWGLRSQRMTSNT